MERAADGEVNAARFRGSMLDQPAPTQDSCAGLVREELSSAASVSRDAQIWRLPKPLRLETGERLNCLRRALSGNAYHFGGLGLRIQTQLPYPSRCDDLSGDHWLASVAMVSGAHLFFGQVAPGIRPLTVNSERGFCPHPQALQ